MNWEEISGCLIGKTFSHDLKIGELNICVCEYKDSLLLMATTIGIQCQTLKSKNICDAKIEALTIVKTQIDKNIKLEKTQILKLELYKNIIANFESDNE